MFVLCPAGEPMDSVCEEAGPREPTKVCQSDLKVVANADIKDEVPNCSAATEVQKNSEDSTAGSSENSQNDSASVSEGGTDAKASKPGKKKL